MRLYLRMPQAPVSPSLFSLSIAQKVQGLRVECQVPAKISTGISHYAIGATEYDSAKAATHGDGNTVGGGAMQAGIMENRVV